MIAPPLSIGQCAMLACLLEATAPKVGNVHRGADFEDLTFTDFAVSAVAIAPALEAARQTGVGTAVYEAIRATRALVPTNTNLGIVLLLAPLAAVQRDEALASGVASVLRSLTAEDSRLVYEAIRLAGAGGLGKSEEMDIAGAAPASLLAAMGAAANRDLIARQYVEDFRLVLDEIAPALVEKQQGGMSLTDAIIRTHLEIIHRHSDSLIARKCGPEESQRIARLAGVTLAAGEPGEENYHAALADLDFYLRSHGHRRNPGATADLLAAALFAALRDGMLSPAYR
jgi:triphosphoribosyl-dephospho-CoA synthase